MVLRLSEIHSLPLQRFKVIYRKNNKRHENSYWQVKRKLLKELKTLFDQEDSEQHCQNISRENYLGLLFKKLKWVDTRNQNYMIISLLLVRVTR